MESKTQSGWMRSLCLALLFLLFLQTGCVAQESEDYVEEWEKTRSQLPDILLGKWKAGDGDGATRFTSDGDWITLNQSDTIRTTKYELTDSCRSFDVPHPSEVEREFVVLKLIKQTINGYENCYAIHFYEVSEKERIERIGVEYLTSASREGWVWERELREQ